MNLTETDRHLIADCADALSVPRRDPADSFVLHASLELLARVHLFGLARPEAREAGRARLRQLTASFEGWGDPVEDPRPVRPEPGRLIGALAEGDLDAVDAQVVALSRVLGPGELRAVLGPSVVRSLAAAAHGSILLHLLDRDAPGRARPVGLARQALRELAQQPTWRLSWFEDPDEPEVTATLADALADVPGLGSPGSDFIYPLMHQAESSGLAPRLLRGIHDDRATAERTLARIAARSMLQEPPDHAPYGWSHCLTMPQATMRLADVAPHATAVAATYVVGFRTALGQVRLDPEWQPEPDAPEADAWFEVSPTTAADLAGFALAHHDAHLAKYTLACIDAATHDPAHRHLYLAAAARLAAYWIDADARPLAAAEM
jgi:hypothetical protein